MIEKVSSVILVNNYTNESNLWAEHGLSILLRIVIEGEQKEILLDTGQSGEVLINNIKKLDIDFKNLMAIVISHGHYDHTGGLLTILKFLKRKIDIVSHPEIWESRLNRKPFLREIGSGIAPSDVAQVGGILKQFDKPYFITKNIFTTGTIERINKFESDLSFLKRQDNKLVQDYIVDDISIVIDLEKKGLLILTGCCHSGIVNTIEHSINLTGNTKIKGIIGGFHLIGASNDRIRRTSEYLKDKNIEMIIPLHCSGATESCSLWQSLGNCVKFCSVGDEVVLFSS
jgi:7,8-dihydropterin-6-yl-methyl-4-(beta-D-ribofuranosyl)aminobenzene 5'-phosphate synthase